MATFKERSRRFAKAASAAWADLDQYLSTDPDLTTPEVRERMFQLESVAQQAHDDYFESVDSEQGKSSNA
ncbi:hypothetical protein [Pseudomonas sp. Gutcm_11s]|uniref:hypothetical protein n=1 Tax=Pseudomonas sp. Gutcm_11s TaxID=3026088 RepID=UPI00235EEB9C|nr:hypothetical protein [Pseudomonas sp. Gutcm_11s]MDD0844613.1 hypothetical protein [Pseudomonas sp. Gutcm_11s]